MVSKMDMVPVLMELQWENTQKETYSCIVWSVL